MEYGGAEGCAEVRRSPRETPAQKVRRSAQKSGSERVIDHSTGEIRRPEEATWAKPCADYTSHQDSHRNTPEGWVCIACHPPAEEA